MIEDTRVTQFHGTFKSIVRKDSHTDYQNDSKF
jgi:hypothetical protein